MSDENKSWTDPITGEVYPGVNPHISIQKSTPFQAGEPDMQPQSDIMPPPQQTPQYQPMQQPMPQLQPMQQQTPQYQPMQQQTPQYQPMQQQTPQYQPMQQPMPQYQPMQQPMPQYQPMQQPMPQYQPMQQQMPRPVQSNITRFCEQCGGVIRPEMSVCPFCGGRADELNQPQVVPLHETEDKVASMMRVIAPNIIINNNVITPLPQNINPQLTGKKAINKWTAFVLCFFFGAFGVHRFYEGNIGTGILYLCTGGLFGIGAFVDMIRILCKPNPYYV